MTAPASGVTVNGTVVLQASATDPIVSGQLTAGMASVQFRLDGAPLGVAITSAPYVLSWNSTSASNATHMVSAAATDAAGNLSTAAPISVTVDNQAPSGSVVINGGSSLVNTTAVTLALSAADNSGTVALMRFSNDGISFSTPQAYATAAAWTLTAGDGAKTVYAEFSDPVGNWSAAFTGSITLHSVPPAIVANTMTIVWATDEPATSQVEYGTTLAYGSSTPLDPALLTSHSVVLTGLVPQTSYYYRLHSRDAAGNEKISANGQFMMVGSN